MLSDLNMRLQQNEVMEQYVIPQDNYYEIGCDIFNGIQHPLSNLSARIERVINWERYRRHIEYFVRISR